MQRVLVTGGTGSFGKHLVSHLLENEPSVSRVVIFSRDELKQWEMSSSISDKYSEKVRFFLGDIRDKERLSRALENIDTVVHAAALKQVPAAEYNPFEFIKTNVIGTQNLVECSLDCGVKNLVALSTDKAAAPINMYGATKLCADKLIISANNVVGSRDLRLSVVRYGNVMGSRGSVIPFFVDRVADGFFPITDERMTRFNISLDEGVQMVMWALRNHFGGEIFVPKIPSYRITDVAKAIHPHLEHKVVGIRPGEKIHEEMITEADSFNTIDLGKYFAILPSDGKAKGQYDSQHIRYTNMEKGKSYNSGNNNSFLTVEDIRRLILENLSIQLPLI